MYRGKTFLVLFFCFCHIDSFAEINKSIEERRNFEILKAIMQQDSNPENSIASYLDLYKTTGFREYFKEALKTAFESDSAQLPKLLKEGSIVLFGDNDYIRIKSLYFMKKHRFNEARALLQGLIKQENSEKNYEMLAYSEAKMKLYKQALQNYKNAYEFNHDDENLLRIVDILINNLHDNQGAIDFLQEHKKKYGCFDVACNILVDIYKSKQDYKSLIEILKEQYKQSGDISYIKEIVNIYITLGDYQSAIDILKKHNYDSKLLINLYVKIGDFESGYELATKKFEESRDYEYLAISAMLEYELNTPNIPKEVLDNVLIKLKNSVDKADKAVYYNHYGYLLIDKDIDVKLGMSYIEKALSKEPKSSTYIDSLAWGYYRLGDCMLAKDLLKSIKDKQFFKIEDVKEHMRLINVCTKKQIKKAKEKLKEFKKQNQKLDSNSSDFISNLMHF